MLQWLYTYVAIDCLQCFICFSNVCYKRVYLDVAYVFTYMLQVFYLDLVYVYNSDVVYVYNGFQVFQICVLSVSFVFLYYMCYI
jgi:hypothetical protein